MRMITDESDITDANDVYARMKTASCNSRIAEWASEASRLWAIIATQTASDDDDKEIIKLFVELHGYFTFEDILKKISQVSKMHHFNTTQEDLGVDCVIELCKLLHMHTDMLETTRDPVIAIDVLDDVLSNESIMETYVRRLEIEETVEANMFDIVVKHGFSSLDQVKRILLDD